MEVQVFDHLRVTSTEGDVELGGSKQQTVLLALVLANGSVVSSDRLIDVVWGTSPPSKPNVTLRSYVSHLRRILEPGRNAGDRAQLLITRSPGYLLDTSQVDVDVHRFTAAADRALSLPLDADPVQILAATSEAFAHWPDQGAAPIARATQALGDFPDVTSHLTEHHLSLSIRHYRAVLDAGRDHEALASIEATSKQHPTSDVLVALHMTALYRAGRSTDALARFQHARSVMLDDFGLDPSPMLAELEQQILRNDPALRASEPRAGASAIAESLTTQRTSPTVRPTNTPAGRSRDMDTLSACLPSAHEPSPGGAILGPAGIGKSTLLAALADRATSDGTMAVWGRCVDTASAATLRPWQTILRDLLERTDSTRTADIFAPQAADLCRVIPELADLFDLPDRPSSDGDISDAIVRTLRRWSENRPLLICLEDLHWSDPESLVVLGHLLESDTGTQLGVIATWRDTDVAAQATQVRAARIRLLADIARAVGPHCVRLQGLSEADVDEVFRSLSKASPSQDDIRRLTRHTGGNPLFVTELVRSGINPDMAPTETIRDVVLRRLDPLPTRATEILAAASLCHPSIDESMVAELTGLDDNELADCFEAALAARLIEDHPQRIGQFRFTHDLLAETLASTLRTRRSSELHAQIGRLLEKRRAPVADIAHHYLLGRAAGASLDAARFAHEAGRQAAALADYQGALRLFDAAIEALDDGPDAPDRRIDITIDRAQVLKFVSEHIESQRTSMRAFEQALAGGELDLAITAGLVYCGMPRIDRPDRRSEWLGYWSPPDESADVLERLLAVMPDDHELRPLVLLVLSNQLFAPHHDQQRARALAEEGIALMRIASEETDVADALISMATTHTRSLSLTERAEMLEEALEITERRGPPRNELRARKSLMAVALDRRDLQRAQHHVERGLEVAATIDDPFVVMQAESMQIALDLLAGDFQLASTRIGAGFERYAKFGAAVTDTFGMQYFTVAKASGQFALIIDAIKDRLSGYDGPAYGAPLAAMMARSGDVSGACQVIDRFTVTEITWGGEGVLQFMTPASFADAVADLALTHSEVSGLIAPLVEALEPAADRMITLVGGADYPSVGSFYIGRLLAAQGSHDAATERLDAAIEHLSAIGARPALLWAKLASAETAAARGDVEGACARVAELSDDADAMGMSWALDWEMARIQHLRNRRS